MQRRVIVPVAAGAIVAGLVVAGAEPAAAGTRTATLQMNSGSERAFVRGENVWLRGKATKPSGRPYAGVTVRLFRYDSRDRPVQVAARRASSSGAYNFTLRPTHGGRYRVKVGQARSRVLTLVRVSRHSIGQRQRSLAYALGPATTGVRSRGSTSWREYRQGVLVSRGGRTWIVRGAAFGEYRRQGGPAGRLGHPVADVVCGLPEGACLQKFARGAIYTNAAARDQVVAVSSGNRDRASLAAVALSQRGYREPAFRKSKYNRWMGRTDAGAAWCTFFTAWTSYAAGEGQAVVRRSSFGATWAAEKRRKRLRSAPAVGRVAYIAPAGGRPHHAGIVVQYDRGNVWTMEGNVDARGGSTHPRGVHLVKRPRSHVRFYADPKP